jgi:hypothetical protein
MINYFNIFTPLHFALMLSSLEMFRHVIFIYNAPTLANDIIIYFESVWHDI